MKHGACKGSVSGHGNPACEKTIRAASLEGFVTGHDFSRAANAAKSARAKQTAEKVHLKVLFVHSCLI
jgi:hypothetical protein